MFGTGLVLNARPRIRISQKYKSWNKLTHTIRHSVEDDPTISHQVARLEGEDELQAVDIVEENQATTSIARLLRLETTSESVTRGEKVWIPSSQMLQHLLGLITSWPSMLTAQMMEEPLLQPGR